MMWKKQDGPLNHNYKDGLSRGTINRTTKRVLLSVGRSLFTCERCGYTGRIPLARHHKDHNRANNEPDNLEVLCVSCHNREHIGERERDSFGRLKCVTK